MNPLTRWKFDRALDNAVKFKRDLIRGPKCWTNLLPLPYPTSVILYREPGASCKHTTWEPVEDYIGDPEVPGGCHYFRYLRCADCGLENRGPAE